MRFSISIPACALLSAWGYAANADRIFLPELLDEIPSLAREGHVSGMDAWRNAESGEIWFLAPDGESIIAGRVLGSLDFPIAPSGSKAAFPTFRLQDCSCRNASRAAPGASKSRLLESLREGLNSGTGKGVLRQQPFPDSGCRFEDARNEGEARGKLRKLSKIRKEYGISEAYETEPDQPELLRALRQRAFWFGVGRKDASPVYAVVDPACPFSAEAMLRFRKHVESGLLHLRIILVATARRDSADALASILSHQDPSAAFWEHSIASAQRGHLNLRLGDYESLPGGIRSAVRANSELASELEIPGVPFFALETSSGAFTHAGVPTDDLFARISYKQNVQPEVSIPTSSDSPFR